VLRDPGAVRLPRTGSGASDGGGKRAAVLGCPLHLGKFSVSHRDAEMPCLFLVRGPKPGEVSRSFLIDSRRVWIML